jgi:syndecan 4
LDEMDDPLEHPKGCHGRGRCVCDRVTRHCECECHVGFAPPFCAITTCEEDCHSREGHGQCVLGKCECHAGFRGVACATEVCPHACSPPNGRCVDGECLCEAGWRGRACDVSTCPGEPIACSGRGSCDANHVNGVHCVCDFDFKGDDCSIPLNSTAGRRECAAKHCGGEVCAHTAGHLAATRRACAVPLTRPPPPARVPAQRRGRCRFDDARSMRCDDGSDCGPCECNAGWSGIDCTQPLCPGSCSGHGWCTDAGCQCYPGFEGRDCAQPTCPRNCSGHGTCEAGRCRCDAGWADADCRLPAHPFRSSTATRIWMPASNFLRGAPGTAPGSVESDG